MNYKIEFKNLSFSSRCAAMEIKRERLELCPDKDRNAFVTHKSNQRQKLIRLQHKFAQFRKNKLATAEKKPILYLMKNKMSENQIAEILLTVGWDYQKVKEFATTNGYAEPSDTEVFWGGFIAGGISYVQKRQQYIEELRTINI